MIKRLMGENEESEVDVKSRRSGKYYEGERSSGLDQIILCIGVMMAVGSAFFPWYVFLNKEEFGVRLAKYSDTRDAGGQSGRGVVSVSPLAIKSSRKGREIELDAITTATIPSLSEDAPAPGSFENNSNQAFPGTKKFKLLEVIDGRALIEDSGGVYMVKIGSRLPDNSKVATFEKNNKGWVIITSEGRTIE